MTAIGFSPPLCSAAPGRLGIRPRAWISRPRRGERAQCGLGKEASKVQQGEAETRGELYREAQKLDISGRSKMGKAELRRAVSRAR